MPATGGLDVESAPGVGGWGRMEMGQGGWTMPMREGERERRGKGREKKQMETETAERRDRDKERNRERAWGGGWKAEIGRQGGVGRQGISACFQSSVAHQGKPCGNLQL